MPREFTPGNILVVDDDPTVRMIMTEVLEELGYGITEARDGSSALKHLESAATIDLLVTDVGLTGDMNGRQLADAARVLRPGLKILFVTGYAQNSMVGPNRLEPGMHVLTKPFEISVLERRVKELIDQH